MPAHRGELAAAALTIIAAYLAAGAPVQDVPNFARFEQWSRLCRYPLIWLGLDDPCATRASIEATDPVRENLQALLLAWHACFGFAAKTIKEVVVHDSAELRDAIEAVAGERGGGINRRRLGKFVAKHVRRIEAGFRFERAGDEGHDKVARWCVREIDSAGLRGNAGFSPTHAGPAETMEEHRRAVFGALGGGANDQPSIDLITQLGVEIDYCTTDETAIAAITEIISDAGDGPIAIDVETTPLPGYDDRPALRLTPKGRPTKVPLKSKSRAGLDPHLSEIRLIQFFGGGRRVAVIDMRAVSWDVLEPIWEHTLVSHNAAFELKFLAARGIRPRLQCTEQAVKLLSGVEGGIWGLADACQTYLGIAVPKDLQISDWAPTELSPGQVSYAAADAVICWRLWAKIAPQLKVANRDTAYRLQRDSLAVAAAMELRGIGIDLDAHAKLCASWRASRESAAGAWSESIGRPLPEKPSGIAAYLAEILDGQALSNWPRTKTGILSTETAQLEKVRHLAGISAILRIKKTDKLLKAFGEPLRKLVSPMTGRLHPHFKVAAAKSGRWSANGPNIQQLPHDKATRSIIVAAPGHVLVSADYSQMELRAAASISGDPELTRVYEQGLDVHKLTAAAIAGVPVEAVTKEQRTAAKAANFGLIYGSGPAGLVASAWANYGVQLTEDEAATIRDRFFAKYNTLGQWMRQHADRCQSEGRIVIGAGRVIEAAWEPFGIKFTLACNAPIQGACADCTMRAIIAVHQRMPGVLVAQIHDELLAEVPEDKAEEAVVILKEAMIEAFAAMFPGAPTRNLVDAKIGRNWAEVH